MKKNFNSLLKLFSPLVFIFLSACGGGSGSGGSSGEAVGGGAIPKCTENASYVDGEYNFMGNAGTYSSTNLYGLGSVCASAAYGRGATGDGQLIAVLDSGISVGEGTTTDLSQINSNIATFLTGSDVINSDYVPQDDDNNNNTAVGSGHGSHVAGLIANEHNNSSFGGHGIAYDATLHIIKVLDEDGSGSFAQVAAGMDLARGVSSMDIVNIIEDLVVE